MTLLQQNGWFRVAKRKNWEVLLVIFFKYLNIQDDLEEKTRTYQRFLFVKGYLPCVVLTVESLNS